MKNKQIDGDVDDGDDTDDDEDDADWFLSSSGRIRLYQTLLMKMMMVAVVMQPVMMIV